MKDIEGPMAIGLSSTGAGNEEMCQLRKFYKISIEGSFAFNSTRPGKEVGHRTKASPSTPGSRVSTRSQRPSIGVSTSEFETDPGIFF